MKEYLQEKIIQDIVRQSSANGAAFYGIQADEVRDVSNVEQLGIIVIRYITERELVEELIQFIECPEVTGEAECKKIIGCHQGLTLDPAQ